jgi:hypothetical protein
MHTLKILRPGLTKSQAGMSDGSAACARSHAAEKVGTWAAASDVQTSEAVSHPAHSASIIEVSHYDEPVSGGCMRARGTVTADNRLREHAGLSSEDIIDLNEFFRAARESIHSPCGWVRRES